MYYCDRQVCHYHEVSCTIIAALGTLNHGMHNSTPAYFDILQAMHRSEYGRGEGQHRVFKFQKQLSINGRNTRVIGEILTMTSVVIGHRQPSLPIRASRFSI